MFLSAMFDQYFPKHLVDYILSYSRKLVRFMSPNIQITFHEFSGEHFNRSEAYAAIETYLSERSSREAKKLKQKLSKTNEEVTDEFEGVRLRWASKKKTPRTQSFSWYAESEEKRYYKLTFHKGRAITMRNRQRKLYTNNPTQNWGGYKSGKWSHVAFEHPSTFDTLAMDSKKKEQIMNDLTKFSQGKEYYKKIGKAWKRGYLLYGPPGTGKSSMIAAMADFLKYDIYDLELTTSLIVIEDIDCSLQLTGQRKKKKEKVKDEENKDPIKEEEEESNSKVTLSGLLNFIDGIWSATGGERIIVFTTNYVEKLDPALIRRGRMDKHIELSYCSFEAFKLFATIDRLLEETNMTPADVAENLMPKSLTEDAEICLKSLIEAVETVKQEARIKAEEEGSLKMEKEKQEAAQEDVKVDESSPKVKESCIEVVKH
ncbi:hypothetical protein RGQ29_012445 [Quercus rubra]|uniref:AAA+ ATPase domain-containing protein n=1 Tax=Quercus rubra TaxID=3512 RepID=A0AAN7G749_QUERU|nr:hypothetical protein RGQ29_012445 [Quercus rubra]